MRKIIRLLLKHGAGLARKKFEGVFLLHLVRDPDVAVLLVENGRNVLHHKIYQLKRSTVGRFTLPFSKDKIAKAKDLYMVFLEHDINIEDIYGMTVLDTATEIKLSEVCAELLEPFPNRLENI